jgi:hypothetical protein
LLCILVSIGLAVIVCAAKAVRRYPQHALNGVLNVLQREANGVGKEIRLFGNESAPVVSVIAVGGVVSLS